tara:strand:+ start:75 stop:896 length:822 start_codon:yes stop_codon:yes gene_type:complete
MNESILIRDIVRASGLIGKMTQLNFINSYQTNEETYSTATEFESDIYGFFLIDYFLQSKPVSPELRQKYFGAIINDLINRHGSELTNQNLDDLIEFRFNKYADIIESADEKWQQRANEVLEVNLKGTKNKNTINEVYPLDIMGVMEEMPFKMAFIQGQVQNVYRASIIAEGLNKGKSLDETTKSIAELENKGNSGQKKKGCYIATMVYGDYDSEEVLTLRKYRDDVLESNYFGRLFIRTYYSLSPTFVKIFEKNTTVNRIFKRILDGIVEKLR